MADYSEAIRLRSAVRCGLPARASLYASKGEFDKAAADLDRAAELPGVEWLRTTRRRAVAHFQLQHYDKALESIAKAVELKPGDFSNLTWLGPAAVAKCPDERLAQRTAGTGRQDHPMGRGHDRCESRQELPRVPDSGRCIPARAALPAFGQPEKALADFAKAIELEPKNPAVWAQRAEFLRRSRDNGSRPSLTLRRPSNCSRPRRATATTSRGTWPPAPTLACGSRIARSSWPRRQPSWPPNDGMNWNTLGVAQYRAGQFKETVATLTKSMELRSGGDAYDWFFLAMAHWQLKNQDEARKWYDKAVEWMEKNKPDDEELLRFRAEAAELLGIAEKTPVIEEKTEKAK